jgi:hypothetical protein
MLSLLFSGCSEKKAMYHGQTKEELKHVYVEHGNAKKQQKVTIKQRDTLQNKCIKKIENERLSYSLACTQQLKALNKNILYWDEVIFNTAKIKESLKKEQALINEAEKQKRKESRRRTWETIKTTVSVGVLVAVLTWLAMDKTETSNSPKLKLNF